MHLNRRRLDQLRSGLSPLENAAIDSYAAGRVSRRDFVRYSLAMGVGMPVVGAIVAACGGSGPNAATASSSGAATGSISSTGAASAGPRKGGTLRIAIPKPSSAIDPVHTANQGAILLGYPSGEYLIRVGPDLNLNPVLANSWKPNADASVWTVKLKEGVHFQSGDPMTSKDVVATFVALSDPSNGSTALSAFNGILSPDGISAIDPLTVQFKLEQPVGSFPYLISSDNYSSFILPADYGGNYQSAGFPGTGRFKMESFDPDKGATFVRYDQYWNSSAPAYLDKLEYVYYADEQPMILALQGGQVDVVNQISVQNARSVLSDPNLNIISAHSAATRVVAMRVDEGPWTDKRVRQALALSIDRDALVKGLLEGRGEVGNDSPFAPTLRATDKSVAQRKQDLAKARQLLADAGAPSITAPFIVLNQQEIPAYAVLLQANAKQVGINLDIKLQDPGTYYGSGKFGSSPWLDATLNVTDYGHRSVPNVPLTAQFKTGGVWNTSHLSDSALDGLIDDFVKSIELEQQQQLAGKMEKMFLDLTPAIYGYFYDIMGVSTKKVAGIVSNCQSQLFLNEAYFTA